MQQLQRRYQQAHTGTAPRVQPCRPALSSVRCRAAAPADTASTVADLQAAIISLSGSKYGHDLSDDTRKQVCGCMQSPACWRDAHPARHLLACWRSIQMAARLYCSCTVFWGDAAGNPTLYKQASDARVSLQAGDTHAHTSTLLHAHAQALLQQHAFLQPYQTHYGDTTCCLHLAD